MRTAILIKFSAALVSPVALAWSACRASDVAAAGETGSDLSKVGWEPLKACFDATLPGTAFTNLLNNGTYGNISDPYTDTFMGGGSVGTSGRVQDVNTTGPAFFTFYYRTTLSSLSIPGCASPSSVSRPLLTLTQASYRTRMWMDGSALAPLWAAQGEGSMEAVGMNKRHHFLLPGTASAFCAQASHAMSLLISPPDHYGSPDGHQGGDHTIAMDLHAQDSAGWDWVAPVPDRNTGVYDDILLRMVDTGVVISDPAVAVTGLLLDAQNMTQAASLQATFRVSLLNLDTSAGARGTVSVAIPALGVNISLPVTLGPGRATGGGIDAWVEVDMPVTTLTAVPLWWPHNLGPSTLHAATATFTRTDVASTPSMSIPWRAGFRTLTSSVDERLGGRVFSVNGQRMWTVGGNYIASDALHRPQYRTAERYSDELRMHREMGMNIVRLWGGHGGHPEALWDATDTQGVTLFQEFWMSGDCNGRWAGNYSWPLDHAGYLAAVADTVRRARGHPSLFLYNGGNELWPLSVNPSPDIAQGIVAILAALEPRQETTYVQSSMGSDSGYTNFDPEHVLAPQDGNYGINDPRLYWTRNPGMTVPPGWNQQLAFQPEIGNTAHPEYESLARFLSGPAREALPLPYANGSPSTVNSTWTYHTYLSFTSGKGVDQLYQLAPQGNATVAGPSWNASEYSAAAGMVQVWQYEALFEGFREAMEEWYMAVIMWKSASPWPAFRGSLYDWYLAQAGGYWGSRLGNGSPGSGPLHVQLNRGNGTVTVVHTGLQATAAVQYSVTVHAWDVTTGQKVPLSTPYSVSFPGPIAPRQVLHLPGQLTQPPTATAGCTLLWRVTLSHSAGPVIEQRDYLLNTISTDFSVQQDYSALAAGRHGALLSVTATSVTGVIRQMPTPYGSKVGPTVLTAFLNVSLQLPAGQSAFSAVAVGLQVSLRSLLSAVVADTGFVDDRVLPQWASDGYFNLLPSSSTVVTLEAPLRFLNASTSYGGPLPPLSVVVKGWNVAEQRVAATVQWA